MVCTNESGYKLFYIRVKKVVITSMLYLKWDCLEKIGTDRECVTPHENVWATSLCLSAVSLVFRNFNTLTAYWILKNKKIKIKRKIGWTYLLHVFVLLVNIVSSKYYLFICIYLLSCTDRLTYDCAGDACGDASGAAAGLEVALTAAAAAGGGGSFSVPIRNPFLCSTASTEWPALAKALVASLPYKHIHNTWINDVCIYIYNSLYKSEYIIWRDIAWAFRVCQCNKNCL